MARSVFYDLFPADEAAALEARSDVMRAIEQWLQSARFTNAAAAKRLGVTRERVAALRAGKISHFELAELEAMRGRIDA